MVSGTGLDARAASEALLAEVDLADRNHAGVDGPRPRGRAALACRRGLQARRTRETRGSQQAGDGPETSAAG
jgi:hypothetical protein